MRFQQATKPSSIVSSGPKVTAFRKESFMLLSNQLTFDRLSTIRPSSCTSISFAAAKCTARFIASHILRVIVVLMKSQPNTPCVDQYNLLLGIFLRDMRKQMPRCDFIPASLDKLPKLVKLSLQVNDFTGSVPAALGNVVTPQELKIGGTEDFGFVLNSSRISGPIPPSFANANSLYPRLGHLRPHSCWFRPVPVPHRPAAGPQPSQRHPPFARKHQPHHASGGQQTN